MVYQPDFVSPAEDSFPGEGVHLVGAAVGVRFLVAPPAIDLGTPAFVTLLHRGDPALFQNLDTGLRPHPTDAHGTLSLAVPIFGHFARVRR